MKKKNPIRKRLRKEKIQKINKKGDILLTFLIFAILLIAVISMAARG